MYNHKKNENSQIWNIVIIPKYNSTSPNSINQLDTTIASIDTYEIRPPDSSKLISDSINISNEIIEKDSIINLSDNIKSSEILGYSNNIKNLDKIKSSEILWDSNGLKFSEIKSSELITYSNDINFSDNKITSDTISQFESQIISENIIYTDSAKNTIRFSDVIIS
jgi:hypothetical protein